MAGHGLPVYDHPHVQLVDLAAAASLFHHLQGLLGPLQVDIHDADAAPLARQRQGQCPAEPGSRPVITTLLPSSFFILSPLSTIETGQDRAAAARCCRSLS